MDFARNIVWDACSHKRLGTDGILPQPSAGLQTRCVSPALELKIQAGGSTAVDSPQQVMEKEG